MVRGLLLDKGAESALVEAGGLAYEIFVPAPALASLGPLGAEVRLHTHFHVREDAQILYGFPTPEERRVFLLLMTVKGVGPKLALGILSHLSGASVLEALRRRDSAALTLIPGVGKKLAERLGVELSDKAAALPPQAGGGEAGSASGAGASPSGAGIRAVEALLALGYPQQQARRAVETAQRSLGPRASVLEDLVKEALKAV